MVRAGYCGPGAERRTGTLASHPSGLVVRDARRCRAPHHEGLRPHPEEARKRRLEGWAKQWLAPHAHLRIPAARFARALPTVSPKEEGAGNAGCLLHPRSRVQEMVVEAHTSIQVQSEHPGIPCAMVLRLMPCSPRRRIPLASVIGELAASRTRSGSQRLRRLDASHGRQDHTVLPYASASFVCRAADRSRAKARPAIQSAQRALPRPPHSVPNVRDDRDTPLLVGRNGRSCRTDLGLARSGLFLRRRLDGTNHVDRVE